MVVKQEVDDAAAKQADGEAAGSEGAVAKRTVDEGASEAAAATAAKAAVVREVRVVGGGGGSGGRGARARTLHRFS